MTTSSDIFPVPSRERLVSWLAGYLQGIRADQMTLTLTQYNTLAARVIDELEKRAEVYYR